MTQRSLTPDEQAELKSLNDAVKAAIETRRKWLDAKMHEISRLKVGDGIYDLDTGRYVGMVKRLHRTWQDKHEGVLDANPYCDYEFESEPGFITSTARYFGCRSFGSREDAARVLADRAAALANFRSVS
jgi:hypothetical protein